MSFPSVAQSLDSFPLQFELMGVRLESWFFALVELMEYKN